MKVTIKYLDNDSLTAEEVVARAKRNYGDYVEVYVEPTSSKPLDMIYFAIQQLVTYDQLALLFDEKELYSTKSTILQAEVLAKLQRELSAVFKDNETKVT